MNTLEKNTKKFIQLVKSKLDNADWDFEASGQSDFSDVEKACNYLSSQKFSIQRIQKALEENWDDIINNIINYKEARTHNEAVQYSAERIAHDLGFERIEQYIWSRQSDPFRISRKWYINETVILKIS